MLKKCMISIVVVSLVALTGCYDSEEIDSLATVMAVGIEKAQASDCRLYTFAIADTGGFSSESKGDGTSMLCFSEEGGDIKSAIDSIDRKLSKRLSFSHLSALIFSKESAGEDMYADVSYFEERAAVRPQTMIAVSDTAPALYLEKLKPSLESNPERYFQNIFQKTKGYVSSLRICDFTNSYHCKTASLAPVITASADGENISEENAFIFGSALISKGKMIAEFTDNWVIGLFLSDKTVFHKGISLKSVKKPKIDIDLNSSSAKVSAELFVETDGEFNPKSASDDMEAFLKSASSKACDAIDVKSLAKRFFFLQKNYDKYDWESVVRNAQFDVNINLVSGDLY